MPLKKYPIARPPLAPNVAKRVVAPAHKFRASPVVASAARRARRSTFPVVGVAATVPIPVPARSYPVVGGRDSGSGWPALTGDIRPRYPTIPGVGALPSGHSCPTCNLPKRIVPFDYDEPFEPREIEGDSLETYPEEREEQRHQPPPQSFRNFIHGEMGRSQNVRPLCEDVIPFTNPVTTVHGGLYVSYDAYGPDHTIVNNTFFEFGLGWGTPSFPRLPNIKVEGNVVTAPTDLRVSVFVKGVPHTSDYCTPFRSGHR